MVAGSALAVGATVAAGLALAAAGALHLAGVQLPAAAVGTLLGLAIPLAVLEAIRNVAGVWRGPPIVEFAREDALVFPPADAAAVRGAAQLRGTMGGAGYLHPRRLFLPAVAWLALAVSGAEAVADAALWLGPWPAVVAAAALLGRLLFPAHPFVYREVTGGGVLASPPGVATELLALRALDDDAEALEADRRQRAPPAVGAGPR